MRWCRNTAVVFKKFLTDPRYPLCVVLFMPLMLSPLYGTWSLQKVLFSRVFVELAFAVWIPQVLAGKYRLPRSPVLYALSAFAAVAILTTLTSQNRALSLWGNWNDYPGLIDTLHIVAYAIMAASVFRRKDWPLVLGLNAAVSGSVAAIGMWEYLSGIRPVSSTLGNTAYLAAYLGISVCLSLAACGLRLAKWQKVPMVLSAIVCLYTLLLTANRGAAVAVFLAVCLVCVLYLRSGRNVRLKWASAGLLAACVILPVSLYALRNSDVVAVLVAHSSVVQRFRDVAESGGLSDRLMFLRNAMMAWWEHPLFGWGPDNFIGAFTAAQDTVRGTFATRTHSQPVEELVTKGAIGLAAYLSLWGVLGWQLVVWVNRERGNLLVLGTVAAGVLFFASGLALFDTPATLMLFALVIALNMGEANLSGVAPPQLHQRASVEPVRALQQADVRILTWTTAVLVAWVLVVSPLVASYRMTWAMSDSGLTWTERERYAKGAFDGLPTPLANNARWMFLSALRLQWTRFNPNDHAAILRFASVEGERGLREEPDNALLWVSLAWLYKDAAVSDGEVSRYLSYLGGATQVAPQQVAALRLLRVWHGPQRSFLP